MFFLFLLMKFLAITLKSLFMLEEVLPTKMKEDPKFINWSKLEKVSQLIREVKCWEVSDNSFFCKIKFCNWLSQLSLNLTCILALEKKILLFLSLLLLKKPRCVTISENLMTSLNTSNLHFFTFGRTTTVTTKLLAYENFNHKLRTLRFRNLD